MEKVLFGGAREVIQERELRGVHDALPPPSGALVCVFLQGVRDLLPKGKKKPFLFWKTGL